jgi:hypothetical protein
MLAVDVLAPGFFKGVLDQGGLELIQAAQGGSRWAKADQGRPRYPKADQGGPSRAVFFLKKQF